MSEGILQLGGVKPTWLLLEGCSIPSLYEFLWLPTLSSLFLLAVCPGKSFSLLLPMPYPPNTYIYFEPEAFASYGWNTNWDLIITFFILLVLSVSK